MIDAKLTRPSANFHASWVESWNEWGTLNQDGSAAFVAARYGLDLRDSSDFAEWVGLLHELPKESFQPPEGLANQTTIWVVEGNAYMGAASLRHSLVNDYLVEVGGNIGYARTIEACGGVLEVVRPAETFAPDLGITEPIRRYWITL